jgi:hypothetical protein
MYYVGLGLACVILWVLEFFFITNMTRAARADRLPSFIGWRRAHATTNLVIWTLVGIYLYIWPDYSGWILISFWASIALMIVISITQLCRSLSPADNQRKIAALANR